MYCCLMGGRACELIAARKFEGSLKFPSSQCNYGVGEVDLRKQACLSVRESPLRQARDSRMSLEIS